MHFKRYTPEAALQWNDFVKTSKNGFFMFDRAYMDYHSDRFEDHSLLLYENNKMIAALPANQNGGVLYSHQGLTFGGFIIGKKMRCSMMLDAFQALQDYMSKQNLFKIVYKAIPYFYHTQPSQEDLYALFRNGANMIKADASSTIDYKTKRFSFSSSRKSGIKKAKDLGLNISQSHDFKTFFKIMDDVLHEKYNTRSTHTYEEMELLHNRFPNNIKLHGCFKREEMLAGIITYETDKVVHTQYIGSTVEGKASGAADLLLDSLINSYEQSKNYFDFGISTENNGQFLNESLISQKEGTGARTTIQYVFELNIQENLSA